MISIGTKAPEFRLPDTARTDRALSEFSGKKTVIAFFPGAFTGVCDREMCTFRDSMDELNKLDASVVGISVDSPFVNGAFAAKYNLTFPLLSDYNRNVIDLYGVGLPDFAGLSGYKVAQRSVFIVDDAGVVRFKWIAPNPGVEPDYEEVRRELARI